MGGDGQGPESNALKSMKPVSPIWLVAFLAAVVATPLHGQDSHYWTTKYGPRAALLGGAVVGSVNDVSAAFYNPGGLAMADSLGFALSLNAFEWASVTVELGSASEDDLSTSRTGVAPTHPAERRDEPGSRHGVHP